MHRPSPPPTLQPTRWALLDFSEETRERLNRLTEFGKRSLYYGWIPLILLLGRGTCN
jgi:hypothetical protein